MRSFSAVLTIKVDAGQRRLGILLSAPPPQGRNCDSARRNKHFHSILFVELAPNLRKRLPTNVPVHDMECDEHLRRTKCPKQACDAKTRKFAA